MGTRFAMAQRAATVAVGDDGAVLPVTLRPAPHLAARSAVATAEIIAGVTAAHAWAGGVLPGLPWLIALTGLVFGASVLVLRGRAPAWALAPGLVLAQLGLHLAMTAMTPMEQMTARHVHEAAPLGLGWRMVVAHGAAGLLIAVVWRAQRRLARVLFDHPGRPAPVVAVRPPYAGGAPDALGRRRRWLVRAARRGPPAVLRRA